ncbi:MAG: hypothetical protein HOM33_06350, partial [Halieaceae bacterium]|nr:hypothetical protein [Halieaceae bacterium]
VVIKEHQAPISATAEKYRYIRDQQRQRRDRGLMFLDDNVIPVLPTWEDRVRSLPDVAEEPIDQ